MTIALPNAVVRKEERDQQRFEHRASASESRDECALHDSREREKSDKDVSWPSLEVSAYEVEGRERSVEIGDEKAFIEKKETATHRTDQYRKTP